MKILFSLFLFIFSLNSNANLWNDLEKNDIVKLNTDLKISEKINYKTEDIFTVDDIIGLDMINVVLMKIRPEKCLTPFFQDMILFASHNDVIIGVTHNEMCEIEIFIENKDLNSTSIFERF